MKFSVSTSRIILFVVVNIAFRITYGLGNGFIHGFDDQYIYSLGLKFYTTSSWPFFGPDVVYTNSQIPGALQSLWVALPLWVLPFPESPYFFLVLAVVGSLSFLSWYLTRLNFSLPSEVIWVWVGTMPWSIFFGSTVINPAYVMIYAIFFMVSLYEKIRENANPIIPSSLCFFLMGFTFISIMQLHLSWVLLFPLIVGVFGIDWFRSKKILSFFYSILFFFIGIGLGGITLYPTLFKYGVFFSGSIEKNIVINIANFKDFFKTIFNFFYFPSYQVITALNEYTFDDRLGDLLRERWWTIPFFAIPFGFGFLQIGFYLWGLFGLVSIKEARWSRIRILMITTILYTWMSFFFNDSGNSAHKYFLFFPLTVIYSVFVLEWAWRREFFRKIYFISLIVMLLGYVIIFFDARFYNDNPYLFHKVKNKIYSAIEKKDYTLYRKTRYDQYTNQIPRGERILPGY